MEIRKTTNADDFEAIGNLYATSWKTAYQGIVPQAYLDELSGSRWASRLATSDYDSYVLLQGNTYIGTSAIAPAREEGMAGWGEIISFYLLPEYWGKGYAKPLFSYVINALQQGGWQNVYLWTLSENLRAQRFYEKQGFEKTGETTTLSIGGKELTEVRYIKRLG